jgi:hypothetical protein
MPVLARVFVEDERNDEPIETPRRSRECRYFDSASTARLPELQKREISEEIPAITLAPHLQRVVFE